MNCQGEGCDRPAGNGCPWCVRCCPAWSWRPRRSRAEPIDEDTHPVEISVDHGVVAWNCSQCVWTGVGLSSIAAAHVEHARIAADIASGKLRDPDDLDDVITSITVDTTEFERAMATRLGPVDADGDHGVNGRTGVRNERPERCYCGGPEEAIYGHDAGTGRFCRPSARKPWERPQ